MKKVELFYSNKCVGSVKIKQLLKKSDIRKLVKLRNIERYPNLTRDKNIMAVPTTLLYNEDGTVEKELVGFSKNIINIYKEHING